MLCAPIVMEPSLAIARLSGKLDELKDVMKLTCSPPTAVDAMHRSCVIATARGFNTKPA